MKRFLVVASSMVFLFALIIFGATNLNKDEEVSNLKYEIYLKAKETGYEKGFSEWEKEIKGKDGKEITIIAGDDEIKWKDSTYQIEKPIISYDELKGLKGNSGRELEFSTTPTHITYRVKGSGEYKNLFKISNLTSPNGKNGESAYEVAKKLGDYDSMSDWLKTLKGVQGEKGNDGKDAEAIELKLENGTIKWKIKGEETFKVLVDLTTIVEDGKDGKDGINGKQITYRATADEIQYKVADGDWQKLLDLDTLKGTKGEKGEDGVDGQSAYEIAKVLDPSITDSDAWLQSLKGQKGSEGTNAPEILLQVSATDIEWQYEGDATWQKLIALDDLTGGKGVAGNDAKKTSFKTTTTHIQWQNEEGQWKDLIELSNLTIKGEKGEEGDQGQSAFDIAKELDPTLTPSTWLDSLKGERGDKGETGDAASQVQFRVYNKEIQWKNDKTSWTKLVALSELTGEDGEDGKNSEKISFQTSPTDIQWKTESGNWNNLISLSSIGIKGDKGEKGKDGENGQTAYEIAKELDHTLTPDSYLASIKGKDGKDGVNGKEVDIRLNGLNIEWQYVGDAAWQQLTPLSALMGKKGETGEDADSVNFRITSSHIEYSYDNSNWTQLIELSRVQGDKGEQGDQGLSAYAVYKAFEQGKGATPLGVTEWLASLKGQTGEKGEQGDQGETVDIRNSNNQIQWKLKSELAWHSLVSLDDLKGEQGDKGDDSVTISTIEKHGGYLAYKYSNSDVWHNIIQLSELVGDKGITGEDGKSAFEVYQENNPLSTLTEAQWLNSLIGEKGEAGDNETVTSIRVSGDWIQTSANGGSTWTNLVNKNTLKGGDGNYVGAYELYKSKNSGYNKSRSEFYQDLCSGALATDFYTVRFHRIKGFNPTLTLTDTIETVHVPKGRVIEYEAIPNIGGRVPETWYDDDRFVFMGWSSFKNYENAYEIGEVWDHRVPIKSDLDLFPQYINKNLLKAQVYINLLAKHQISQPHFLNDNVFDYTIDTRVGFTMREVKQSSSISLPTGVSQNKVYNFDMIWRYIGNEAFQVYNVLQYDTLFQFGSISSPARVAPTVILVPVKLELHEKNWEANIYCRGKIRFTFPIMDITN